MVRLPGLADDFVPEFRFRAMLGYGSGGAVIILRRLLPGSPGRPRSTDTRKTRYDLRHALDRDFSCRERQNAFAICPSSSPFRVAGRVFHYWNTGFAAITVSSSTAACCRLAPSAPATWL
jgi:hypothetical protein